MPVTPRRLLCLSIGVSSLALATVLTAAPLQQGVATAGTGTPVATTDESELAKATKKCQEALDAYTAVRKAWTDRAKAEPAKLLKDSGFPKPFTEDPLAKERGALSAAKADLATKIGDPAPDTDEAKKAVQVKTDSTTALTDAETKDKKSVLDAYRAFAKALADALGAATKKPADIDDEEPELTAVRYLKANKDAAAKVGELSALLTYLPEDASKLAYPAELAKTEPGKTDPPKAEPPPDAFAAQKAAKQAITDLSKAANQKAIDARDALGKDEVALRTYLEKQTDARAAFSLTIKDRRRVSSATDTVDALNQAEGLVKLDDFKATAKALGAQSKALLSTIGLVEDDMSGAASDWVQEAVPVFYFGSVPRLITALNLQASRFESTYFRDLDSAKSTRAALLDNEDARDALRVTRNDLIATLGQMRTEIQVAKARRSAGIARMSTLSLQKDRLTKALEKAKDTEKPTIQAKLDATSADLEDATKKDADSKDAVDRLDAEIAAKQSKLGEIENQLQSTVDQINKLRISNARLAAAEVEAFREASSRRPFWYVNPFKGSGDPLRRCAIFGYDDSLVLFVRGKKEDVEKVKGVIASFDRPSPQARVTLHTLQFNGSDPKRLADTTAKVETTLNGLRGNLTLVQDALRNAISAEVNRQARVSRRAISAYPGAPFPFSERVLRGFYYPREIREALGLRFRIDDGDRRYRLAAAVDDLDQAIGYFQIAWENVQTYDQLHDRSSKSPKLVAAESAMTAAANHYGLLVKNLDLPVDDTGSFLIDRGAENPKLVAFRQSVDPVIENFRGLQYYSSLGDLLVSHFQARRNRQNPPAKVTLTQAIELRNLLVDQLKTLGSVAITNPIDDRDKPAYTRSTEYVTAHTLPDPSRGTTLGELLFVFSLGGQESRIRILHDFSKELLSAVRNASAGRNITDIQRWMAEANDWFAGRTPGDRRLEPVIGIAGIAAFANDCARLYGNPAENTVGQGDGLLFPYFPRTIFGGFSPHDNPGPNAEPMTANQLEILTAIQTRVRAGVLAEAFALVSPSDANEDKSALDADRLERLKWLTGYLNAVRSDIPSSTGTQTIKGGNILMPFGKEAPDSLKENITLEKARKILERFRMETAPDLAAARVAAADDMIKRFVTVLEDDLQHYLVGPALDIVRNAVNDHGNQFANYQSTSILATNRTIARYDASAVATLGQDPEAGKDAALAAQQLSDIVAGMQGGEFARRAGGIAPFVPPALLYNRDPKATGDRYLAQGALGLLIGALLVPDETTKGDLYSLTSGGEFKLTPIFDPSGQALRFTFDYALSTRLLDPLGGQRAELPRVERQSFNTEIQITNLEFRRVAEFSANTRIGVPEKRSGGFPVLKELPVFKDIPLLGYFVRTRGTPAVRQQTYVFAQTSLYPTVSDIVNLLLPLPLRNLPAPDYQGK